MQKSVLTSNKKTYSLVFIFFILIYLSSSGGHPDGYDGIVYFLLTENMVREHSIKIDPQSPSLPELKFDLRNYLRSHGEISAKTLGDEEPIPKVYVNYAVFLSAIAIPLYILAMMLGQDPVHFVPYFLNSTVMALMDLVVFAFALEVYRSKKIAFALSLFVGVTSFVWAYKSTMFTQPLLGLCAISATYFLYMAGKNKIRHSELIGGILLGSVLLAHPSGVILLPGMFAYAVFLLRKDKMKITKFFIVFLAVLFLAVYLNEVRFGSFYDFGYRDEEGLKLHQQFVGGLAMIFSPGKGIFFLFPLSILVPLAIWSFFKENKGLCFIVIYIFIVSWLWFGSVNDPNWGANGNWGPRYLVPTLPFLVLPLGILFKQGKKFHHIMIGLAICGFFVNLLGALVWDMYGYSYGWERLELWKIGDKSWSIFTWDITRSPMVLHWEILNSNYLQTVKIPNTIGDYHHIGLAPCQYDSYLYCTAGIIPILILYVLIATTFFFLWKDIKGYNPVCEKQQDLNWHKV